MSFETDIHCDSCRVSVYICHHDYVETWMEFTSA